MATDDLRNDSEQRWTMKRRDEVDPKLINIVSAVLELIPDMPESVQQIMTMVCDPRTCAKEIAKIAADDPVLITNILRKVNSAYYSLDKKIGDLNFAIVVLGFNEVRDLAIQCGLASRFGSKAYEDFNPKDIWGHMYAVSICAEEFSENKNSIHTGLLMTVGMLHDIGKFALQTIEMHLNRLGVQMGEKSSLPLGASHIKREECIYGVNHAVVGSMLAEKWNLSPDIYKIIEYHHYPMFFPVDDVPAEYRKDVALISIADFIANTLIKTPTVILEPHPSYFEILGVTSKVDQFITPVIRKKFERVKEFIRDIL